MFGSRDRRSLAGLQGRPPLLLAGHSDTVPIGNGWTRDPFAGEIDDGRLYGRVTPERFDELVAEKKQ